MTRANGIHAAATALTTQKTQAKNGGLLPELSNLRIKVIGETAVSLSLSNLLVEPLTAEVTTNKHPSIAQSE